MSTYNRCTKCASDMVMDGAFVADATTTRIVVGVDRHPDRGRLERQASTQIHASICGSCGFVELYANQPQELYAAYSRIARPKSKTPG